MLHSSHPPLRQPLGNGLELCTAATELDLDRVAAFNGRVHGPDVEAMTRNLFLYHPYAEGADLLFVDDRAGSEIVSSLCLIPWTLNYCGVDIPAGEMGIVGTAEPYRRRGLIRAQVEQFRRRLDERSCLVSHIQGIPFYYRQFGYEYALPLEGGLRLGVEDIGEPSDLRINCRPATMADLPVLAQLYDAANADLAIRAVRDDATWCYLLEHTAGTAMECERWLVQSQDGTVVGYFGLPRYHFGRELVVSEASRLTYDGALAALAFVKKLTLERAHPGIRLNLAADCTLMEMARSLGARDLGTYQWQIYIPNALTLLRRLGPVFERRIAESPFSGLTRDVRLGLYRRTILLRFVAGALREVTDLGFTGWEDIRVPPLQLVPLVLGHRTLEELHAAFPDADVAPAWRLLVATLFPRVTSFLYTTY